MLKLKSFILFFILLFLLACAHNRNIFYQALTKTLANNQYEQALINIEADKEKIYGNKNALLYYLDKGFILHLNEKYSDSNIAFEKAKKLSYEYFTKSITTEATTLLVSDNTRPYYGEDYERVYVNIFGAINYALMNKNNEALVEARQVDHLLKTFQTNYNNKNLYKDDAFARYLMGMLYENKNQINDAYISYVQALKAYIHYPDIFRTPVPSTLLEDIASVAFKLNFNQELKELAKQYKVTFPDQKNISSDGELIMLHYNGIAPHKIEDIIEISFGKAWAYVGQVSTDDQEKKDVDKANSIARNIFAEEQVRIAFPKYINTPYEIFSSILEVKNSSNTIIATKKSTKAINIGAIAKKSLEQRIAKIRVRAFARAAIKFALAREISNKVQEQTKDDILGWFAKKALSITANLTERADTRCWRILPNEINITKVKLPAGKYSLNVLFNNNRSKTIFTKTIENIKIRKGKKTFVIVRTAM